MCLAIAAIEKAWHYLSRLLSEHDSSDRTTATTAINDSIEEGMCIYLLNMTPLWSRVQLIINISLYRYLYLSRRDNLATLPLTDLFYIDKTLPAIPPWRIDVNIYSHFKIKIFFIIIVSLINFLNFLNFLNFYF